MGSTSRVQGSPDPAGSGSAEATEPVLRHLGRPPHPLVRLCPTKERRELGMVLAGQECLTRQWMLRQPTPLELQAMRLMRMAWLISPSSDQERREDLARKAAGMVRARDAYHLAGVERR